MGRARTTKVTGVDDSLSSHARLMETSFLNSDIPCLTRCVVRMVRTTTIKASIMGTDPIRRFNLIERTTRVLAALTVLIVGGDVVIRTTAFGATDRAIGVRSGELEASGTLLKVDFLLPCTREDLSGEHDDGGIGERRENRAINVLNGKGDIGADVGGGNRSDSPIRFLNKFGVSQKRMRTFDLLKETITRP